MSSVINLKSVCVFVACAGLVLAGGCGEEDEPSVNDFFDTTTGGTTAGTTGATTATTGDTSTTTGDTSTTTGDTSTTTGDTSTTTGTPVDSTGGDGGATTGTDTTGGTTTDGGTEAGPDPVSVIAGTYTNCSSYAAASGEMCAGYYCSITQADVANELQPGTGPCSNLEAERVCGGRLTTVTGECARMVKSNPFNALDTDDELRVKIRACIYEEPDIDEATVPVECTECFLEAAQCASDHCLGTCLAGDSPECDQCRLDNNCNQPVPTCGGLPSPF